MEEERKPIFTNLYMASEESYRQLYRRIRRVLTWVVTVLAIGAVGYMVYAMVHFSKVYAAYGESFFATIRAWFLLVLTVYLCINIGLLITSPRRLAKKALKRVRELNNDQIPEETAEFYEDTVTFRNSVTHGESTLSFASFAKIHETKDLFLIWTKQKMVIPLAKDGFTGIDVVGFRAFMDEHCPQAKRRWTPEG